MPFACLDGDDGRDFLDRANRLGEAFGEQCFVNVLADDRTGNPDFVSGAAKCQRLVGDSLAAALVLVLDQDDRWRLGDRRGDKISYSDVTKDGPCRNPCRLLKCQTVFDALADRELRTGRKEANGSTFNRSEREFTVFDCQF